MTTLFINRFDSRCGACGKSANPHERRHESIWAHQPGEGCGAEYTSVSSDYTDHAGLYDRIREMRPDLPFGVTP